MTLLADARALPSRCLRWLESWPPLRRLDRWPFGRALLGGFALGLAFGAAVVILQAGDARWLAAGVVVALAGAVAWSGKPVGIWEPAVEEAEPLLEMVGIEGGSFVMGSPEDEPAREDDEKQHRVTLSPFRISRTTVTRAQYLEVMERDEAPGPGGDEHPVSQVSWFDVVAFCNRLSEREELPPCYRIDGDQVTWTLDAGGYRLPTESEWEYAARAGSTGRWSFGEDESELGRYAWFEDNSDGKAHPVATREPNPWGLHDMHGNVWEWCWDAFGEYPSQTAEDPRGRSETPGAARVLRGGAFFAGPGNLRSAFRDGVRPELRGGLIGFRCVRRPVRQP